MGIWRTSWFRQSFYTEVVTALTLNKIFRSKSPVSLKSKQAVGGTYSMLDWVMGRENTIRQGLYTEVYYDLDL